MKEVVKREDEGKRKRVKELLKNPKMRRKFYLALNPQKFFTNPIIVSNRHASKNRGNNFVPAKAKKGGLAKSA